MIRITHTPAGSNTIQYLDASQRLLQRNLSYSPPSTSFALSAHFRRVSTTGRRFTSKTTATSQSLYRRPTSTSALTKQHCLSPAIGYNHVQPYPISRHPATCGYTKVAPHQLQMCRAFQSMTVTLQSVPLNDFSGGVGQALGKNTRDKSLHPLPHSGYKKPMTLEEAMGYIKPLELSPELTLMKEKELHGAKIIDGKAIAK